MKNVHFSIINYYYCLFTSVLVGFYLLITYIIHPNFKRFTLASISIMIITGISHVGAIICYTLAFQYGKTGKIALIAYS